MNTTNNTEITDSNGKSLSPQTSIETIYFEIFKDGTLYRNPINNHLLLCKADTANTTFDSNIKNGNIPLIKFTSVNTNTDSHVYQLDTSAYPISQLIKNSDYDKELEKTYISKKGGLMEGTLYFEYEPDDVNYSFIKADQEDLIVTAEDNLYLGKYIYLWYEDTTKSAIELKKPTVADQGKYLKYDGQKLSWSQVESGGSTPTTIQVNSYAFGDGYDRDACYFTGVSPTERSSGSAATLLCQKDNNLYFTTNGNVYGNMFYSSSDERMKHDIEKDFDAADMPKISKFKWNDSDKTSYGFIAQELEKSGHEELVDTANNGYKRVNYTAAFALYIKGLTDKIEKLEQRISELEKK